MRSAERSISSAVQKEAFLYIRQMSAWWMGKSTKRCEFSCRSGSGARSPSFLEILCFDCFLDGLGVFLALLVGMGCLGAEFVPVVSVVTDEVGDFTKGLIRDGLLEGHVLVW